MKTKSLNFEVKELTDDGTFTAYASVFGETDLGRDNVVKGAFKKTLNERKSKIKLLWGHDKHKLPLGTFIDIIEDDYGLLVTGKLNLNTVSGNDVYQLLKTGAIDSLSIGYSLVLYDYDREEDIYYLKEIKLYEISLVNFPMLELATVTDVKDLKDFKDLSDDKIEKVIEFIKSLEDVKDEPKKSELELEKSLKELMESMKV